MTEIRRSWISLLQKRSLPSRAFAMARPAAEAPHLDLPRSRILFIGQCIGTAGELLTRMIRAMGFNPDAVPVIDPSSLTSPLSELEQRIRDIQPEIIISLGEAATQKVLQTDQPLTALRGTFQIRANFPKVMPTFDPETLVQQPEKKREAWEDLKKVLQELKA